MQVLRLYENKIGDAGLQAFAGALRKGALAQVTILDLGFNQIGDAGLTAIASVCASGALASLEKLVVDDEEPPALQAACQARGVDLQ